MAILVTLVFITPWQASGKQKKIKRIKSLQLAKVTGSLSPFVQKFGVRFRHPDYHQEIYEGYVEIRTYPSNYKRIPDKKRVLQAFKIHDYLLQKLLDGNINGEVRWRLSGLDTELNKLATIILLHKNDRLNIFYYFDGWKSKDINRGGESTKWQLIGQIPQKINKKLLELSRSGYFKNCLQEPNQ